MNQVLKIEAQAFPKSAYSRETFLHFHRRLPETFLVLEQEKVRGYIIFEPNGHIISLAVDPAYRRGGIGTRLMNACESHCASDILVVEVRKGNKSAQSFYKRLGFCVTSRVPLYYGTEDAYVMEKRMSSADAEGVH